jgi:hypothetical protein
MRFPKMTTRRWMVAVAAVAILAAICIEAQRAWKLKTRYASALRSFQDWKTYYGEGRATLEHAVEKSQCLMEAELALCATKTQQITAIEAHLTRALSLIEEEINWPLSLHDTDYERAPYIAAARESLLECKARLNKLKIAR